MFQKKKTQIYVFLGLRVIKKVALKSEALIGGVLQGAFNHEEQFCKIHGKTSALKSLFNKGAGLMVCNFIKKEKLWHRCFPVSCRTCPNKCLSEMNPKKSKSYSQKLFSGRLHRRCFSIKIKKFYRISFSQNTAAQLLLISCNNFNESLALSVKNQFRRSQLSGTFRKEKCLL